jgi:hypothetical protein
MSERNIELHRSLIEAFNERDIDAYIALTDPRIEFHSHFAAVGGAVYHGHNGMRRWQRDLDEAWGTRSASSQRPTSTSVSTRSLSTCCTGADSTAARRSRCQTQLFRWRDGLVVHFKGYAHREDALRDLGVSEAELEPIAP